MYGKRALFMALLICCFSPAWGQVRYGLKGGVVSSDTTDSLVDTGTGYVLGATFTTRLTDRASLQWEILVSKRGGRERQHGLEWDGGFRNPQLTYAELPFSYRFRVSQGGAWYSELYCGAFASINMSGSDALNLREAKSFDTGLLAGWELGRETTSGRTFYLDIRFASGLVDTVEQYDSKSRSIFGTVGVRF